MLDDIICDRGPCPMEHTTTFDNPYTNILYELYTCTRCGMIVKYDRLPKKDTTFLTNTNEIIKGK